MAVFVIGRSSRRPLWRSGLCPTTSVAGTGSGTSASRERMDGVMPQFEGAFEPETVKLLRGVLDEAWDALTPEQQTQTCKSDMALRILQLAQRGELDPSRLRMAAMTDVADKSEKRPPAPSVRRGSENSRAGRKQMFGSKS